MSNLNVTTEQFESKLVNHVVYVHLKRDAMDIVTNPTVNEDFYDIIQSVNQSPELRGYVEINDSGLKLLSDSEALAQFISQDNEEYVRGSRNFGYLHDIIAADSGTP